MSHNPCATYPQNVSLRRIPAATVKDINEVATRLAGQPEPLVLIFDADNTVVPQGVAPQEFAMIFASKDVARRILLVPAVVGLAACAVGLPQGPVPRGR